MCIRWGSNPRLRRDWGLNPTPSWLIVDERPTRPRIQMCRKYFVRDSDRVRTRIDLVRIDPATLAGVDFKSTALTTRPHYLAQVPFRGRPTRESNPEPSDFQSVQILCGVVRRGDSVTPSTRRTMVVRRGDGVAPSSERKQLRRDSNPQPPDSKSDTLSIAPRSCFCVCGGAGV